MAIKVPSYVSDAAQRGLDWHRDGKSGDGVTDKTLAEAREMAAGTVSEDKLRRMEPWFQRHRGDMDAPKNKPDNEAFPGAGAVAWALWGGPTSDDIMRTADWAEAKAEQLDRERKAASASARRLTSMAEDEQLSTMPRFITDIDGTILDDKHQPIQPVLDFIDENAEEVVVLTNRPESERAKTEQELAAIDLDYEVLIMNDTGKPAPEFKAEAVKKMLDAGERVDLFIDNDPDNREAVEALGVEVMDPAAIVNSESKVEDMSKTTPEALVAQLNADLSAITAERDTLSASANTIGAELVAMKESFATLSAERDALALKVKELEAAQATASAKAAEMVAEKASASAAAAPLKIAAGEPVAALTGKDLKDAYLALSGKEQAAFFAKHKAELYAIRKAGL